MINIESLVEMGANVKLELTPGDLQKFAESIVERTIIAHGKVMAQESAKEETYLNTREVCAMLGVCEGTLITWAKRGYLVPRKVGGKNRYAKSDIQRIHDGGRTETVAGYCKRKNHDLRSDTKLSAMISFVYS